MKQYLIDAFAERPFTGNPACVVEPFDVWPEASWMQALAMENNQAETAYLLETADPARFGLRWFTPALEIPLCGHATLASAHALLTELGVTAEILTFDTLSGPLRVRRDEAGLYELDFPARPARSIPTPEGLEAALGAPIRETWASSYGVAIVENEAILRSLKPDLAAINQICTHNMAQERGNLIVATLADKEAPYQVVSRFFAPGSGIPEDPVTGSAHCILAPLFTEKLGQNPLTFFQAYPGRGGGMICEVKGDRVLMRGRAVTVLEGKLRV